MHKPSQPQPHSPCVFVQWKKKIENQTLCYFCAHSGKIFGKSVSAWLGWDFFFRFFLHSNNKFISIYLNFVCTNCKQRQQASFALFPIFFAIFFVSFFCIKVARRRIYPIIFSFHGYKNKIKTYTLTRELCTGFIGVGKWRIVVDGVKKERESERARREASNWTTQKNLLNKYKSRYASQSVFGYIPNIINKYLCMEASKEQECVRCGFCLC